MLRSSPLQPLYLTQEENRIEIKSTVDRDSRKNIRNEQPEQEAGARWVGGGSRWKRSVSTPQSPDSPVSTPRRPCSPRHAHTKIVALILKVGVPLSDWPATPRPAPVWITAEAAARREPALSGETQGIPTAKRDKKQGHWRNAKPLVPIATTNIKQNTTSGQINTNPHSGVLGASAPVT